MNVSNTEFSSFEVSEPSIWQMMSEYALLQHYYEKILYDCIISIDNKQFKSALALSDHALNSVSGSLSLHSIPLVDGNFAGLMF